MGIGRIVVLNGPSSSGKTSIARALQEIAGPTWLVLSIDQLFPSVHRERSRDWSLFESLTKALAASAFCLASSGFDIVVDTVFEESARRPSAWPCTTAIEPRARRLLV